MGLGRQGDRQSTMWMDCDTIPKSRGHAFYDRLQAVLVKHGFDRFVEDLCAPFYAESNGRRSIPPGRYFRMHLVGYFEAIHSERGIEWRCADSFSLREFLLLRLDESVPDHSSLSRIRSRFSLEVHDQVFQFVIGVLDKEGLIKGKRIGVDASTMEANAALKTIVRRDTGENYRQMLGRMAKESGIKTPSVEDLTRMDRNRKGKKLSNEDWKSPTDPDSRIAKMKDGRTRLAYKPEHAVDLDTGAIVAAKVHKGDEGDTTTIGVTLEAAEAKLKSVDKSPTPKAPSELVTDKGYHKRDVLKDLDGGPWKTRMAERKSKGLNNWKGDHAARRAVYNNRARVMSGKGKAAAKLRTELVERSFEHTLGRGGGMRRVWLHGVENVEKRYLIQVAGFNLGLVMRKLTGKGTPKGAADFWNLVIIGFWAKNCWISLVLAVNHDRPDESMPIAVVCIRFGWFS
jgi:transposase